MGLSLTYEKLAVRLCSVLQRRLTNQIRDHSRVMLEYEITLVLYYYIPRRKSGIYWIQVRRAAAAVEISLWTR